MSFFDLIESDQNQQPDPVRTTRKNLENRLDQGCNKPQRQWKTGRRLNPAPEKLKFLKPCPICQGREFVHGRSGGFFCSTCQPGIEEGHPVFALGYRKAVKTIEGLPCAGCGSTTYRKEKDGYLFPDGTFADGLHCGGKMCGAKLLIGNKEADQRTQDLAKPKQQPRETKPGTPSGDNRPLQHFQAAFPWIKDHLSDLLAAGWTRPELFRRSKYSWPHGQWGAAWLSSWCKPDVSVAIDDRTGGIRFSFSRNGKIINQIIQPLRSRLHG